MQRRQFVTSASATVVAASLAGCSGILGGGGGGGGSSGPQGAVEAYVDAVNDNDAQAIQDLAHPEGSGSGGDVSDSDLEGISMSIQSMETLEQSDGQATVEAEIETTFTMGGEEQSATQTIEFDVRQYEGEWLIYGSTTTSTSGN
jgi:hypothetical protein